MQLIIKNLKENTMKLATVLLAGAAVAIKTPTSDGNYCEEAWGWENCSQMYYRSACPEEAESEYGFFYWNYWGEFAY